MHFHTLREPQTHTETGTHVYRLVSQAAWLFIFRSCNECDVISPRSWEQSGNLDTVNHSLPAGVTRPRGGGLLLVYVCVSAEREGNKFRKCVCVCMFSLGVLMSNSLTKTQHMSCTWCPYLRNGLHHSHLITAATARLHVHTPSHVLASPLHTQVKVHPVIHTHSTHTCT